jgi:hypothetical protein
LLNIDVLGAVKCGETLGCIKDGSLFVDTMTSRRFHENACVFIFGGISFLIDDRATHRRVPPTLWFVAETTERRLLKVVCQMRDGYCHIITAYEPNAEEIRLYERHGKL